MTDNAWTDRGDIETSTIDLVRYDVEACNGHIGRLDESPMEAGNDPLVADTDLWILGKRRLNTAEFVTQLHPDNETVPLIMTRTRSSMPCIGLPLGPTTTRATSPRATSDSSGGHMIGQHRPVMASTGVVDEEHDGVVSETAADMLHRPGGQSEDRLPGGNRNDGGSHEEIGEHLRSGHTTDGCTGLGETVGAEHHPIPPGQLGRRHLALVSKAHGQRLHALDLSDERVVANV